MKSFLFSLIISSFAFGLSISPPIDSNGKIILSESTQKIMISNRDSSSVSMNLSVSSGMIKIVDRCSGLNLKAKGACYIVIKVNSINDQPVSSSLSNNGDKLADLSYSPTVGLESSDPIDSSINLDSTQFLSKEVRIQNKTSIMRSYSPSLSGPDADKFEILTNRCSNVFPKKTCIVNVKLKPQVDGDYSAILSEPQLSSSINIRSHIVGSPVLPKAKALAISSNSLSVGTIYSFGMTKPQVLTLTNNGNQVMNPIISKSSNMKILFNRCSVLKQGQSCSLTVAVETSPSQGYVAPIAESINIKPDISAPDQIVNVTGDIDVLNACSLGKHRNGAICEDDVMTCSVPITGIKSGIKTWTGSSFGSCIARSQADCYLGFSFNSPTQACDLTDGILQLKYEPLESMLAISNQNIYYVNQSDFSRILIKFTLPVSSYVNSFSIKVSRANSDHPIRFGIFRVDPSPIYTIDNCCVLGTFDTTVSSDINSSTLLTFSKSGSGILLSAGDYFIMEEPGYMHDFDIPLYYSPMNVSSSIYGQEWKFGYKPGPVYSGGDYVPFNLPPSNYAPYFKIKTTPYSVPIFLSSFTPDESKSFKKEDSVIQSNDQPLLTMKIRFTVTSKSYIHDFRTKFIPRVPDSNLSLYFQVYKDNLGNLGQLVATSLYSSQFGQPSAPSYNLMTQFNYDVLEPGDYWIMDTAVTPGLFPIYSTEDRIMPNKILFYTCEGVNFLYGTQCGSNFESAIYGVPVSPYYDIELIPY